MGRVLRRSLMASLLDVRDLHVSYRSAAGGYPALAGVNFCLGRGETLGVLGESGSGKSTLAATLLRLLPAGGTIDSGQILLDGVDVLKMNSRELQELRGKRLSLISQEPSLALHPTMRVGEQVGEVLRSHEARGAAGRSERVRDILGKVFPDDAGRITSRYAHELSGGQRQRVLIAQAIACEPGLLVADEPTASLDPSTQHEILSLFRQLQRDLRIGVVFITHNPALLLNFAERVLVLYGGKVVECGPTKNVLLSPQHPYTRALLRCVPAFEGAQARGRKAALPIIGGVAPNLAVLTKGCVFEPRCADRMEVCLTREPRRVALDARHEAACLKFGE